MTAEKSEMRSSLSNNKVFKILKYVFETYLDMRQHVALKLPTLPQTLEGVISQEKYEMSRAYSLYKSHRFAIFSIQDFCDRVPPWFQQSFMILKYIFETYLDMRQHAALKLQTLPQTLKRVISQENFEKSRAYSLDKSHFDFLHELVTILMNFAILFFRVLPWFWKKSGEFVVLVGLNSENEIIHTLAFWAGRMFWLEVTDLPFSLYRTFVIESRHGFNKQTVWLFFRDSFKGIGVAVVRGPLIVSAIIIIVQEGGPYLAINLWASQFVLSLVWMTLYPILIAPLFNKFTPLPDGDLRKKIENLASSLEFPLKKLFVVDGSTRSSHSNNCFSRPPFVKSKVLPLHVCWPMR